MGNELMSMAQNTANLHSTHAPLTFHSYGYQGNRRQRNENSRTKKHRRNNAFRSFWWSLIRYQNGVEEQTRGSAGSGQSVSRPPRSAVKVVLPTPPLLPW